MGNSSSAMAKKKADPSTDLQKPPIRFRILGAHVVEVHINAVGLAKPTVDAIKDKVTYHTDVRIGVRELSIADVILAHGGTLAADVVRPGQEARDLFAVTSVVSFELKDYEPHIAEDGQLSLSQELMFGLVNAAIGTARGMIWNKLLGTPYESLMIPLVPFDQLREMIKRLERVPSKNKPEDSGE